MSYQYVTGNFPTKGKPQNDGADDAGNVDGANRNSDAECTRFDIRDGAAAQAFPALIAEWPRNKRETVRVTLEEFNGRKIVSCRTWWLNDQGDMRPGKSGMALSVKHLPDLADALAKALVRARELGLVAGGAQ